MNDKRMRFNLGYLVWREDADENQLEELVYQSNLIEGLQDDWIGTHDVNEKKKSYPTLTDHFKALKLVVEKSSLSIDNEEIKRIHNTLMHQLMDKSGEYRSEGYNFMSNQGKFIQGNPLHDHVPKLMDEWIKKSRRFRTFDSILDLHYEFEAIHPFYDGNGRTGRLLLNWMTLQKLDKYIIVENEYRKEYFKEIDNYRKRFFKENPQIRITTYDMLPKETKERLRKEKELIEEKTMREIYMTPFKEK